MFKHKNSKFLAMIVSIIIVLISTSVSSNEKAYKLLADDVLQISVWKETDLQRKVLILPDGKISFPLVGHLKAAGLTPEELEQIMIEKLARFIPDPVVTVSVSKLAGYKIFVLGKVTKPGQYIVSQINVMQALSLAGGLARFANESDINVLRQTEKGQEKISFNYSEVSKGKYLKQNIALRPGDVLVVR